MVPGAITAPAPVSEVDSGSIRTRDAHEAAGTGTSAVRNWTAAAAVCGRTRTQEMEASGSKRKVRFSLCEPVVAVHDPGETTRTPSDMPLRLMPCTQPEAASTFAPSRKWQIQS